MRDYKDKKGFFTFAQNSSKTNYLKLAYALALSLKASQSTVNKLSVGVTPGQSVPDKYRDVFDEVVEIPWGDNAADSEWKLENEWKAFHITPYENTVKLDCDMLFFNDISSWWELFETRNMCATSDVTTYRGEKVISDFYRKAFTANKLPNIYSGLFYFDQSDFSLDFFKMVEIITFNWQHFFWEFAPEESPKEFSTDVAFALAAKLLDETHNILSPIPNVPTFVHMKTELQGWDGLGIPENWMSCVPAYLTPDLECKIGHYRQNSPLHYHLKDFMTDEIISFYEKKLDIRN